MKYNIPEPQKRDILDDSIVKQTLDIIENLLEESLDLNITSESEVVEFLDYPERFVKDQRVIGEIRNLKELIIEMSDIYYVE